MTFWGFMRSCLLSSHSKAASFHHHPRKVSLVGAHDFFVCLFLSLCVYVFLVSTGMTKVKVGMDDPSSVEFVERRRAGLERQGSIQASYIQISLWHSTI